MTSMGVTTATASVTPAARPAGGGWGVSRYGRVGGLGWEKGVSTEECCLAAHAARVLVC